jgi:hypothetical protein
MNRQKSLRISIVLQRTNSSELLASYNVRFYSPSCYLDRKHTYYWKLRRIYRIHAVTLSIIVIFIKYIITYLQRTTGATGPKILIVENC